ncbi:DUF4309 domain-containing protein [Rossellomorea vietnamensis]|uniref:beta-N-acetylhexosaminidase n=1 Tax=Rossellomorea vietnamensis TaxID=218284 RepID=A0A5D4NQG3_9BACI|nr:glycoside hydrolase family 3 N-terminal domain-containing protein [Rossellomorea vietnamensis]TYS16575.1 DUF4309 domain-containing protein [Rossellomorea vietnamensis]
MSRIKSRSNRKKRKTIIIGVVLSSALLFISLLAVSNLMKEDKRSEQTVDNSIPETHSPSKNDTEQVNIEKKVEEITDLASEGKVLNLPFVVGRTNQSVVHKRLGSATAQSVVNTITYENYNDYPNSIGFKKNVVADLRSEQKEIQEIHYSDILGVLGEADTVTNYEDSSHHQVILAYDVSPEYRLRWVLEKPKKGNENPSVHHISLLGIAEEEPNEQSAKQILSKMTLEEKIGQLIISGVDGTTFNTSEEKLISDFHVGGFIFYSDNLETIDQTKQFVQKLNETNAINKLPLFISVDEEGGRVSRLPEVNSTPANEEIGRVNDKEYAYSIGEELAEHLKTFGFNMDYAPVLDINSNPNNPVIGDRSYGSNETVVSNMGIETMKGIQSKRIVPVIKHFPGHGDTSVDSHVQLPVVNKDLQQLQDLELIPFKKAIQNGAQVVMVAHILLPNLGSDYPASMSAAVVGDLLRNQLKFKGIVMTDDMTMGAIVNNYGIGEASVQSLVAGSDILLIAHNNGNVSTVYNSVLKAVENGVISEERINESVIRIINLKKKYLN